MNLYLISPKAEADAGQCYCVVAAAADEENAGQFARETWKDGEEFEVELIGLAKPGFPAGVIVEARNSEL